jgi:uncharacterized phage protein gp47/JayE
VTSPTAAVITPAGITAPTYAQVYAYLVEQFQAIYGADSYLGNDSQDGQWIGAIAQAISDANSAAIAVYNAFSPTTAVGNGLSSNVKLNGLARLPGSYSTVALTIVGVAQTPITNGLAQDASGNTWALPPSVTIPASGTIIVTATCAVLGAVAAAANTITVIQTPVQGWQSVNNAGAAVTGVGVETDAALRVRQAASVELPSLTIFDGIIAALQQITGVGRVAAYENNTSSTNGLGIPANSLAFVVEGGPNDSGLTVATAIAGHIAPGIPTYYAGTGFSNTITDASGTTRVINSGVPTESLVTAQLNIHPLTGWNVATEAIIRAAVSAYFTSLPIGQTVNVAAVTAAALLLGSVYAGTFLVKGVQINIGGGAYQSTDIALAFNQAATPGVSTIALV